MRQMMVLMCAIVFGGCSVGQEKLQTYLEEPRYFIQDPHFESYQNKVNELESLYLGKKISYVEYVEKKKELDEQYEQEVLKRDKIIRGE